jgi:hypothetical protein
MRLGVFEKPLISGSDLEEFLEIFQQILKFAEGGLLETTELVAETYAFVRNGDGGD